MAENVAGEIKAEFVCFPTTAAELLPKINNHIAYFGKQFHLLSFWCVCAYVCLFVFPSFVVRGNFVVTMKRDEQEIKNKFWNLIHTLCVCECDMYTYLLRNVNEKKVM